MFRHNQLVLTLWCSAFCGLVDVAHCAKVEPVLRLEKDASFRVLPAGVSFSKHLSFTDDGKAQPPQSSLSITVAVRYGQGVSPISFSGLAVDEATTDCGENLAPQRRLGMPGFEFPIHMPFAMPLVGTAKPAQKFDVQLPLECYQKPCSKITKLTGRLTVKYAARIQDVKVKPVAEWVGKRIVAPGLGNREVYLDELTDRSVKIRMKTDVHKQLKEVKVFDASDKEQRSSGYSGHGGMEYFTYEYRASVPKDGSVVFRFYDDVRKKEVPFAITDLPLP
jgi:hypothetical protein